MAIAVRALRDRLDRRAGLRGGRQHPLHHTPIGFVRFLKIGLPTTIVSIALATGYIAIRYVAL